MLDNFYSIIDQLVVAKTAVIGVRFNKQHPIFEGHFPGMPVVPGACLLQITCDLVSSVLQKKFVISSVQNVKFVQVIYPDKVDRVSFDILWSEGEGGYSIKCLVQDEGITYAMMKLTLRESDF